MRQVIDYVEQLVENGAVYLHRDMLFIENYAVLVVISIWRILYLPFLAVDRQRNGTQVLSRRVRRVTREARILGAEHALGVGGSFLISRGCDITGVLFRLGAVYRDVQGAVFTLIEPLQVLGYSSGADVIQLLADVVVPVGRLLR